MARELITDASGKVTAVSYIDKATGEERQVRCRTVVLSAAACESARLLLNSKSPRHPQGIGNQDGAGRQVPHRHGRLRPVGAPCRTCAARRRSLRRATARISTSRGGWRTATTSWISRCGYHVEVGGGGFGDAGARVRRAGATTQSQGYGLPMKQAIRDGYGTAPTSASPAADRRCRTRTATAKSIRTARRTSGAFRSCGSTGSGATTS